MSFIVENDAGIFHVGNTAEFELIHALDQLGILLLIEGQLHSVT